VCLVLFSVLGVGLYDRFRHLAERRAQLSAQQNAFAETAFLVDFDASDFAHGISARFVARLPAAIRKESEGGEVTGVETILAPDTLVVDSAGDPPGVQLPDVAPLAQTVAGHNALLVLRRGERCPCDAFAQRLIQRYGSLLAIYERASGPLGPSVVTVTYLRYDSVIAPVNGDLREMALLFVVGFGIVWVVLCGLMLAATLLGRQRRLTREITLRDRLTGLPNRTSLRERTGVAVNASRRSGTNVALLVVDIDRFKDVNDTLGHASGDLLLREIARRLGSALRQGDTVARLGGDEFAVLLPDLASPSEAALVAAKLLAGVRELWELDGVAIDIDASIGIAFTPDHGDDFDELMQHAEVAMYLAKDAHIGMASYDPDLDIHTAERLALLAELRQAIQHPGELVLFYQPKVDSQTRTCVGVEALVRWQHPQRGLLAPDSFIPAAERTGLIQPLTLLVLDQAFGQLRRWTDAGLVMKMAVNISAASLLDPDFPTTVHSFIEQYSLDPGQIELELTETAIMTDPERALTVLTELAATGLTLSIDDFGTGYSSMSYLKRLPVRQIKIDRSFITAMDTEGRDAAIVRSSIDLARELQLEVVAEGVETQAVWSELAKLGCSTIQGYLLTRPVPAEQLVSWLEDWRHDNQLLAKTISDRQ
jgi:diguanylate cyclase (GGDEF)-like protein